MKTVESGEGSSGVKCVGWTETLSSHSFLHSSHFILHGGLWQHGGGSAGLRKRELVVSKLGQWKVGQVKT